MDIAQWIATASTRIDVDALDATLADTRVVYLGESNHFVHEKVEFRLKFLDALAARGKLVIGEELGWCDGRCVAQHILAEDDAALFRAVTFGYQGHARKDRDDLPGGVFGRAPYPHESMCAEHRRFYDALRGLPNLTGYFGFDIDVPGGAYEDLPAMAGLARVDGETRLEEAGRLESLLPRLEDQSARQDLLSLIESLRYTDLVKDCETYEATRPAMAYREQTMKRRIDWQLQHLPNDTTLVLMAHAFHLAKRDANIEGQGVGPGGASVSSIGEHVARELRERPVSCWMLYGAGEDSQPLADLPRKANFPSDSLNRQLAAGLSAPAVLQVIPAVRRALSAVRVGHLYNLAPRVDLGAEADFLMFFPRVMPLRSA